NSVALKVIIEHRSEKLLLSSGIPSTVEQLHETVKGAFGLIEDFTLHYLDEDLVSAEFQRITTGNLEPKCMSMLDHYSPKLLSLFQAKNGAAGEQH
ncbi:hypothetical protein NFI96_021464, partial [Prochilodus magdalenae]